MRRAFTLIELLVVVAVIAVLISILLPALAKARIAGRGAVCQSNMRQIMLAITLYTHDHAGNFPRTMDIVDGMPVTNGWWRTDAYQRALGEYIGIQTGSVDTDGQKQGRRGVWFDPSDPDLDSPAIWGSFTDNGFITGVSRRMDQFSAPSITICQTLRERDWDKVVGVTIPDPLPVESPDDPFWSSEYFDLCLDPWAETTDTTQAYHWSKGRARPPSTHSNEPDAGDWDRQIDGRSLAIPAHTPRYGRGQFYSFCDGSVRMHRFEETYAAPGSDWWSVR